MVMNRKLNHEAAIVYKTQARDQHPPTLAPPIDLVVRPGPGFWPWPSPDSRGSDYALGHWIGRRICDVLQRGGTGASQCHGRVAVLLNRF